MNAALSLVNLPSSVSRADDAPPLRVLASGVAALDAVLPGGDCPNVARYAFYQRACDGGAKVACENLKRTEKN